MYVRRDIEEATRLGALAHGPFFSRAARFFEVSQPGAGGSGSGTGAGVFEGRLSYVDTTHVNLGRYSGDAITINGSSQAIGSAGLTLITTDNLITNTGADSGGAMAINTLYYIYASNSAASFGASGVRGSTTAPTRFNGTYYLGTSGNAANWRFVGWVRTISNAGTANFADSETQRLVVNYYNRQLKRMYSNPAYVNDNTLTAFVFTSATWAGVSAGADTLQFISNGEDLVWACFHGWVNGGGNAGRIGLSWDAVTTVVAGIGVYDSGAQQSFSTSDGQVLAVGLQSVMAVAAKGAGGNLTFYSDTERDGVAADPQGTAITAMLWC